MASSQEAEERLRAALADRYLIESGIGEGGMATVYQARDLKHDRKVAVKVLKPELSAVVGTERFLAEIRTTANLSHPHILPLFDSGEADGFLFYVMPLVEGDSLRERLDRDGQLPVGEALRIAGHVADALESAHRDGVIHRDLKPANILFQKGEPVVADFGIALAVSSAGEGRLTETGLSLGTPYYMSPEQATGDQTPTAASDVYSLGCVLYEMLTGEPPHTGTSAQAILGKILLADVTRPTKLRRTIPANVEGAILKALERLPADRFESVAELAVALKDKGFRHGVGAAAEGGLWNWLSISLAAMAVLTLAVVVIWFPKAEPPAPVVWQPILPPGDGFVPEWGHFFAMAPDGSSMVYRDTVGLESGWQLWVRERGLAEGRLLPGTKNAQDVTYSPDGEWIAFHQGSELFKQPIQGGVPVRLLEGMNSWTVGASWMDDGTILAQQGAGTLVRIPQDPGGVPDTVIVMGFEDASWVHGLPGEEAALVIRCIASNCRSGTYLSVVDLQADTTWMLMDDVLRAWYVPSGHVVWVSRDGAVFATPFDLAQLELSDHHIPLFEDVRSTSYLPDMVMGEDGTVVYVEGSSWAAGLSEVVWVDRAGNTETVDPNWGAHGFRDMALSPDGQRLAVSIMEETGGQIWVKGLPDRPSVRITTGEGVSARPKWTPDGTTIAYSYDEDAHHRIRTTRSDRRSAGGYEVLLALDGVVPEAEYTNDGQGLVFRIGRIGEGEADIGFIDLATGEANEELLATEFNEFGMVLSPDNRWLAHVSEATGRGEVVVRPFPDVFSGFTQISIDGGTQPVWGQQERNELFYRSQDGWMTAVTFSADSEFSVESQERLFDARGFAINKSGRSYDIGPSGDRFLMALFQPSDVSGGERVEPRMILIQNFFTLLQERLGGEE